MAKIEKIDPVLKFRFSLKKRINIYKKLKAFTEEQFPVYDSLIKFKNRYNKQNDFRGKIMEVWINNMKNGAKFSTAIQGWVPDSELNLISSGEDGSGIENGLAEAIKFAESAQKIKKTIIMGSTYPAVLILVILGFVAMFSIKLAPTYLSILALEQWPELGRNFYYFSKLIIDYWYVFLAASIGLGVLITAKIGTWTGPTRDVFDKLPPWSVYKVYHSSAFLISLSSMMQSGTPLNDALKKIKKTTSPYSQQYIDDMLKNLKRGGTNFGQHLDVGLLDKETAGDVIDYSELGNFERAVYKIGENNLNESVEKIQGRMALVRNLMIALVGVTVGIIYFTTIELNTAVAESASTNTTSIQQRN